MSSALLFLLITTCSVAIPMSDVQRKARCGYDLSAIQTAMKSLAENSRPGDVVFTDDWDVFPVYFYYNSRVNYVVGLDPKFTHERRPELWERYVMVSRGKVPADVLVEKVDELGTTIKKRIHIELDDIREHFGARFVIVDRDHKPLAAKLAQANELATLVHPAGSYETSRNAPYLIFIIHEETQDGETNDGGHSILDDRKGVVYLSSLTPDSITQGWGDFVADRSVGGGPIQTGKSTYKHGLGTHAPSRLEYAIPPGYNRFEATVGINRSTKGEGSVVVSVQLDDVTVYTSRLLTGTSYPQRVHVALGNARTIVLEASPSEDGMRSDHVDWAAARFTRTEGN